ncbi:MAG: hypothetical protein RLZZ511_3499 [Cyanobacteriota bacterium]|jgi:hypothetical protein
MNQLLAAIGILVSGVGIGGWLVPPQSDGRSVGHTAIDWSQWVWAVDAIQGLIAVGAAKMLFPNHAVWEIVALMAVTAGRWWRQLPGGVVMMLAGYTLHNPISGLLVLVFGMIGTTLIRDEQTGKLLWLMLMPLVTAIRDPRSGIVVLLTAGLAGMIYGLTQVRSGNRAKTVSKLFRPDSLDDDLYPDRVGEVVATLAQLHQQGLPVPMGWVIYPGDDPQNLGELIQGASTQRLEKQRWRVRLCWVNSSRVETIAEDCVGMAGVWAAIATGFETYSGEAIVALVQVPIQPRGAELLNSGQVYCQAPTLKADVPSAVAQRVVALVERLNAQLNTLERLAWVDDGVQVWVDRAD